MSEPSEQSPAASTPVCTGMSGEWEQRTLCPDESCLGVLGTDGCCRLCGLRGDLSLPPGHVVRIAGTDLADPAPDAQAAPSQRSTSDEHDRDDFDARALCERDDCIGVLDVDGVCKVCGLRAVTHPA